MGYEEYWKKRLKGDQGNDKLAQQVKAAERTLRNEFQQGFSLDMNFFCITGRKPL